MSMHKLCTHELSCGHSSTLSQPTGRDGGSGISGGGLGVGSGGRMVWSSATGEGISDGGPAIARIGTSGSLRGTSVIGGGVVILSVEVA